MSITVGVQAQLRDPESWLALARRLEASGFAALLVADHPGSGPSPWPALGAAASVTTTLGLGTYVLQAGVRDPVLSAADAATLDLLAPGRVLFGVGAGHTFREWEVSGRARPSAADRAGRLVEFVEVVHRLLQGETVTLDGRYLKVVEVRLQRVPVDGAVRLLVGVGGNRQLLRLAAARASVVGLAGLGRTLPDGHQHEPRWSPQDVAGQLAVVRDECERAGTSPEIEALVQVVTETDARDAALAELRDEHLPDVPLEHLASAPFVLIGTVEEMAAQLVRQQEELGITRYVVREPAVPVLERVLALLPR